MSHAPITAKSRLVNFFIVGAPKAGTSSLYHYFNAHPEIVMSERKEPNYFSQAETESLYAGSEYKKLFVKLSSVEEYHNLFKGDVQVAGEASVSYLFFEKVPERIKSYNSDAKIIICLRNPMDRAISHFQMDKRLGLTDKSLSDCINEKSSVEYQQYILVGKYYEQVKRYLETFGPENVLILQFEDIKHVPDRVCESLCRFLEVGFYDVNLGHRNSAKYSKNSVVMSLYRSAKMRKILKSILPLKLVSMLKARLFTEKASFEINESEREKLVRELVGDVESLESLLGHDFDDWKVMN